MFIGIPGRIMRVTYLLRLDMVNILMFPSDRKPVRRRHDERLPSHQLSLSSPQLPLPSAQLLLGA